MKTSKAVSDVKVSEIMTRHVDTLSPGDTIQDAVKLMVEGSLSTVPVVDAHNKCVGILSRSDLTEMFLEEDSTLSHALDTERLSVEWLSRSLDTSDVRKVKELMTYEVTTIRSDLGLIDACKQMARLKVHHLPVVDENEIIAGIVSAFDVVTAIAEL